MKNRNFLQAMLAMMLALGMAVVGCGESSAGGGDDPGTGNGSWTSVDVSGIFGKNGAGMGIYAIAYGNGKFIAGGWDATDVTNPYAKMAYSSDGIKWTEVTNLPFDRQYNRIGAIAYGNNKLVAGDSRGKMAYSSDGVTWTAGADSQIGAVSAIAYGNGRFVAGGSAGKIAYSTDGVTWTAVTTDAFDRGISFGELKKDNIKAIAYGNNTFVATGDGTIAYSTDNGVTWTAVTDRISFYAIAYGNNTFFAGGGYAIATSTDGVTWTKGNADASVFGTIPAVYGIAYGNNKFVAGLVEGTIVTSPDGVTWTRVYDQRSGGLYCQAVAYGNGTFVAGGGSKITYSS